MARLNKNCADPVALSLSGSRKWLRLNIARGLSYLVDLRKLGLFGHMISTL